MATKASDKICLSSRESCPPPAYAGRHNHGFEADLEANGVERHAHPGQEIDVKASSNGGTVKGKKIRSICLCTASVYPHYHGETIIDNNVYDEILIIDPKELQTTSNKTVHFKGQCLRICKFCILVFIVLVGLACGLYGVAHYFIVNKGGEALMTNGDVKLLQYSTYFCERIKAEPAGIQRSLVVLERSVGDVANFFSNMTFQLTLSPQQQTYEQSFYAIVQGVMRIVIESEQDVEVLIFDTESKLNNWKNNKRYAAYNFKRRCCKDITINRGLYSFKAEQDRRAFFVLYSDGPQQAEVNLTLSFERSFIDYKRSSINCFADVTKSCAVPVSFASDDKVVIGVPKASILSDSQKVEWSCEARVWFYVCVFLGIFIAVIIIMCFIYCLLSCCFCDPCCCCFCCYIVAKEEKNARVVQYHCGTLRHNPHYASRTPRGPRARQIEGVRRQDSNDSIIKHGYTTSDTSDTEGRDAHRRLQLSRVSSTTTTHSLVSNNLSRRRSSSSIGSDLKRGMSVDEDYEELPPPDAEWVDARGAVANGNLSIRIDDVDGHEDPRSLRRAKMSRRARRGVRKQDSNDGYSSDIEERLRMKKAQFSDSEEEDDQIQRQRSHSNRVRAQKPARHSDDEDDDNEYDYTYDVVGFQVPGPSMKTAEKIDTLPLGPSGAPPEAPPKSKASIKGKPGLKSVQSLEILHNGMIRANGEKLHKSKSDVMQKNARTRKQSPMTPHVIVLNGKRDMYSTYERKRSNDVTENGLGSRTISLDSGLERIDGTRGPKIRPAADVKF